MQGFPMNSDAVQRMVGPQGANNHDVACQYIIADFQPELNNLTILF